MVISYFGEKERGDVGIVVEFLRIPFFLKNDGERRKLAFYPSLNSLGIKFPTQYIFERKRGMEKIVMETR